MRQGCPLSPLLYVVGPGIFPPEFSGVLRKVVSPFRLLGFLGCGTHPVLSPAHCGLTLSKFFLFSFFFPSLSVSSFGGAEAAAPDASLSGDSVLGPQFSPASAPPLLSRPGPAPQPPSPPADCAEIVDLRDNELAELQSQSILPPPPLLVMIVKLLVCVI